MYALKGSGGGILWKSPKGHHHKGLFVSFDVRAERKRDCRFITFDGKKAQFIIAKNTLFSSKPFQYVNVFFVTFKVTRGRHHLLILNLCFPFSKFVFRPSSLLALNFI
jgi:hypothetical protein